jgi:hypothetical protein
MDQMPINPAAIVSVPLTGIAELMKPVVFSEGNMFCCLLGHDPQTGVMGCGDTPELALSDWDRRLKQHLATHTDDDYIVQYVKHLLPHASYVPEGLTPELTAYLKRALRPPGKR